ncbi:MAG TPA: hypothetical protein VFM55_21320, partial [Micromonosporaceae bacterium]|nr:hypothetical protein [Micromonosporaceae bacterium]
MRAGWAVLLAALVAAGCDVGPVRRVPQEPAPPAAAPATPEPPRHEVRAVRLPVPPGSVLRQIELADSRHGYALVAACTAAPASSPAAGRPEPGECPAALAATADGGLTWQARQHPRPVATDQQLYVGGAHLVLLHAEPYGWYVSTDAGQTFAFRPGSAPPPEYAAVAGRYGVWCEPAPCRVVEGYPPGGGRRPVPAQPGLPGELTTVAEAGRELWAVSVAHGRAYPAVSLDQGRSWQRRDLPSPGGGPDRGPGGGPVSRAELR